MYVTMEERAQLRDVDRRLALIGEIRRLLLLRVLSGPESPLAWPVLAKALVGVSDLEIVASNMVRDGLIECGEGGYWLTPLGRDLWQVARTMMRPVTIDGT